MGHAREEYLYQYIRIARIILLKATHWPYVAAIYAYESTGQRLVETVGDWGYKSQSHLKLHHGGSSGHHTQQKNLRYSTLGNRSEASLPSKIPTNDKDAATANSGKIVVELNEVKKTMGTLSMQEKMEQRLDTQQALIEKLSRQVDELNRRLAKRDGEDEE
ncbi:MAG: hypothetical protein Q9195_001457 [Heterodermia aff. obscurata]